MLDWEHDNFINADFSNLFEIYNVDNISTVKFVQTKIGNANSDQNKKIMYERKNIVELKLSHVENKIYGNVGLSAKFG